MSQQTTESSSYRPITNDIIRAVVRLHREYPNEGGADLGTRLDGMFKPHQINAALSNLTRRHAWALSEDAHLANAQQLVGVILNAQQEMTVPTTSVFELFGEKVIALHRTDPRTPVTELNIIESHFTDYSRGTVDADKIREIAELFNDSANEIETVRVVGNRTMYRITAKCVIAVTEIDEAADARAKAAATDKAVARMATERAERFEAFQKRERAAVTECHFCDNPADGSKRSYGFPHCGCQTVECDHTDDRVCDALGHANHN